MDVFSYIEEFKVNNYENFDAFYKETSRQVYFAALGILKDPMLAEDVLQDTYISFLEGVENYKYGYSIYAYLITIARNKSLNIYNKEKRIVKDDEYLNLVKDQEKVDDSDAVKRILGYLDKSEDREIVVYHVLLDLKFKEIAKILSKPLGTILWQYNKAMKLLRERVVINEE